METQGINLLKKDFEQTKNELESISKENKKIRNMLNQFFDTKSTNKNLDESINEDSKNNSLNIISYKCHSQNKDINQENLSQYKEELQKVKNEIIDLKNNQKDANSLNKYTIERKKSNNNINVIKKENYKIESTSLSNKFNINNELEDLNKLKLDNNEYKNKMNSFFNNKNINTDLKEILGVFTSFGLENNKLKSLFDLFFKDKNDLFEKIESNSNDVIINLLKMILQSYNINILNQVEIFKKNNENILNNSKYIQVNNISDKESFIKLRNKKKKSLTKNKLMNKSILINKSIVKNKSEEKLISFKNDKSNKKKKSEKKDICKNESLMKPRYKNNDRKNLDKSFVSNISNNYIKRFKFNNDSTNLFKTTNTRHMSTIIKKRAKKYDKDISNGFEFSLRNDYEKSKMKISRIIDNYKQRKHFPEREKYLFHESKIKK